MKIVFLSDAQSYHTQRWVNYFVDRGHQCILITLDQGLATKADEFFIPAPALPHFLKYPLSFRKVKNLVTQIKPDLINAHYVPSYGFIGALLNAHPLVISTWGSDVLISPHKSWLHKLRAEYILRRADLVTTDAMVTAEAICQLGVEKEKVLIHPMGIEKNLVSPPDKSESGSIRKEKPYLLVLSNRKLEPLYDVSTLIKAIPLVIPRTKKKAKFVILGAGSQKNQLIHLARNLRIENDVEFKGVVTRDELLQYYRDSDLYVSTSTSDSTSVSLLEAMSFGLIPVVTDIPGNREWIEDKENGFLFPASNHLALAEKIVYVMDEFLHGQAFRERNHAIIKSKAVWEDNMEPVEAEFLKLVG